MIPESPKPIPLFFHGDHWTIDVDLVAPNQAKITCLIRYPKNDLANGSFENFKDLEEAAQQAILQQIQRRYRGVTIKR